MYLSSYREILDEGDVAFAVKTNGIRFSFDPGGTSITGNWNIKEGKKFNKVLVFKDSDKYEVYIGDFYSLSPAENGKKFKVHFVNGRLTGIAKVNWTEFTEGRAPGYSRILLYGKPTPIPAGIKKPKRKSVTSDEFERDERVKQWVLRKAGGKCECCHRGAPFTQADDTPYLEVHHVKRLADGGSDTVTNAVAICPNCHRELHLGINAPTLTDTLYTQIERLVRE